MKQANTRRIRQFDVREILKNKKWISVFLLILFYIVIIIYSLYSLNHQDEDAKSPIILLALVFLFSGTSIYTVLTWDLRKIRIKHETARKIEIFGYILLFMLLVWQFAVKDVLTSLKNADYYLTERIDNIFFYISTDNEEQKYDKKIQYMKDFGRAQEDKDRLEDQANMSDTFYAVLQICSTVCIAIGRFYDLIPKIDNKSIENTEENRKESIEESKENALVPDKQGNRKKRIQ